MNTSIATSALSIVCALTVSAGVVAGQTGKEPPKVEDIRKAAESGDAVAMTRLGICYQEGTGVQGDLAEAEKWYRKAVALGNAEAMNLLGTCCSRRYDLRVAKEAHAKGISFGDIKLKDLEDAKELMEAVGWYRKAAAKGSAAGMFSLAVCYDEGRGVTKNNAEAVKWYQKAVDAGSSDAMCNLGSCYLQGRGVEKNKAKAVELYKKARSLGNMGGKWALKNMGEQ